MTKQKQEVIVICGPTASGKSEVAFQLAKKINAEIISADSMQIYKEMDIGTAKISSDQNSIVKHHMINIVEPTETYSVAMYSEQATKVIRDVLDKGKNVIVCGGTGQYINALLDGLIFIDIPVNEKLRNELSHTINEETKEKWHQEILKLDPESAKRINVNDLKRVRRFFEVYLSSKMTQSEINKKSRSKGPDFNFISFYLKPDREQLYERINKRTENMFSQGLASEVEYLLNKYPKIENCQSFQAIGYKETVAFVRGHQTQAETIDHISKSTRNYAKRQYTWFNARDDLVEVENNYLEEILNEV
ncbi:MAG: tRNA (adenosine(37)-N6)-dimethylallyltransferase MiaA [Clostridiaceae bacterium]|nr:tRNA (adenosine(37)-N6)-dimethylallyltransferase MiaA [Clostridiaceae bacterium]